MKTTIKKFLLITIALSTLTTTAFADFSDVSGSHKNYEAIQYLQETGVLNGYNDGTFKPGNSVSRSEFLKIVIEGSNIELDINTIPPFNDLDYSSWYIPYIQKAHAEEWIAGYEDGAFKPDQTISKAESLKILGKAQKWELPENMTSPFIDINNTDWHLPYVSYAKTNDLLEEEGNIFAPTQNMTRAKISEMVYRTLPKEDISEIDKTPIPKDYYEGITFKQDIPSLYYKNEIYSINGEVESESHEIITAILENAQTEKTEYYSAEVENGEFEIPIFFKKTGKHYLGIVPGKSGKTKALEINIISEPAKIENSELPQTPNSLNIEFENGRSKIQFDKTQNTYKKISLSQQRQTITYISRQEISEIPLNIIDFEHFKEKSITVTLSEAFEISSIFSDPIKTTFTATKHQFSEINEDEIKISPPETAFPNKKISLDGKTKTKTSAIAYIITPQGTVEEIELSTASTNKEEYIGREVIKENKEFNFEFTPAEKGTYIIEINNQEGIPIVNHPIYVGGEIPLIPSYFDKNIRKLLSESIDIQEARKELLNLTNESRKQYGLSMIETTEELNKLAQAHSDDMAENSYFSHINKEGETPDERRLASKISTPVSENIVKDVSIKFGHEELMRSASHRGNILTSEWEIVGIGITEKNGFLYITEEFAIKEITAEKLEQLKSELLEEIQKLRETPLLQDQAMENVAKSLNNIAIIDQKELTNDILKNTLEEYEIDNTSRAIGRIHASWTPISESILEEESEIYESKWKSIGIDVQIDEIGDIHLILIVNES